MPHLHFILPIKMPKMIIEIWKGTIEHSAGLCWRGDPGRGGVVRGPGECPHPRRDARLLRRGHRRMPTARCSGTLNLCTMQRMLVFSTKIKKIMTTVS